MSTPCAPAYVSRHAASPSTHAGRLCPPAHILRSKVRLATSWDAAVSARTRARACAAESSNGRGCMRAARARRSMVPSAHLKSSPVRPSALQARARVSVDTALAAWSRATSHPLVSFSTCARAPRHPLGFRIRVHGLGAAHSRAAQAEPTPLATPCAM